MLGAAAAAAQDKDSNGQGIVEASCASINYFPAQFFVFAPASFESRELLGHLACLCLQEPLLPAGHPCFRRQEP